MPTIVFSQFAGTSLWFAGNAILPTIQKSWGLATNAVANITTAVMLGFILGTFLFALFSIADRFKPSRVFLMCAILGAMSNIAILVLPQSFLLLLVCRFFTGFFLAGIYPVGMKIASDWYDGKLGKALGYLVGALVLGTAFPHLLNYLGTGLSWTSVLIGTSTLAITGGLLMVLLVGEGPNRKIGGKFEPRKIIDVFKVQKFKYSAFGYFGHMWELYAFWAFLPFILNYYNEQTGSNLNVSLWSFVVIAIGAVGCIGGGFSSIKIGSGKVAYRFLLISGILCGLSPILIHLPPFVFITILIVWGIAVIGDSAQFSTLNAQNAPAEFKGTALTIVVSIGFLLTIPSIQLLGYLSTMIDPSLIFTVLLIGPIFGLIFTRKLLQTNN
ncbi:MFS transporter [Roseivirga misakiensis]|uniref:MFS transporter n=1 Tax=Roseivirga misakiensis TaxID=1563681 RepID=UPI000AC7B66A|nr:MFS transporter [Roseivirga misakiensis]